MEREKKKALLDLIKECDDVEYLRQISYTAIFWISSFFKCLDLKSSKFLFMKNSPFQKHYTTERI